ncbi:MAG: RNA polymerase sigma factor [Hominilimicola sp.]
MIHLFYYEDMSVREIAESIDIKESTVKSHLHRGRMLLKNKLKGDYDFV